MPARELYRVAILGSGPAGLTAAIYTARASLAPIVLEGGQSGDTTDLPGGQLMLTTEIDNYPGFPKGILGPDLMQAMREQAERFGAELVRGSVKEADLGVRPFRLTTSEDVTVQAEAVIVATGARARWLNLPRELEFRTRIGGVSACATCDGFFYKGKDIIVVGGGDTAMEEAVFLTKFARTVTIVHRRDALRASKIMQERARRNEKIVWRLSTVLEEYIGTPETKLTGVVARDLATGSRSEIPVGGVFMAIGHDPNTRPFRGLLEMDENGYLLTSPGSTETSVDGVFAAGDVQDRRYRQAITAAGSGCMAAIDAERYLEL